MFKLLLLSVFVSCAYGRSYTGYKVFEVTPSSKGQADQLMTWESRAGVDFWTQPRVLGDSSIVMINPDRLYDFQNFLNQHNLTWTIKIEDVDRIVTVDKTRRRSLPKLPKGEYSFDDFHRHDAINDYLDALAEKYPDLVTVTDEGKSYEGRTVKSILISDKSESTDKGLMILDAGIHAREWIAPAFAMYVIHQLVEHRDKNEHLLRNVDWLIVPLLNPDGYEYTHIEDRLWRKTRSPNEGNIYCTGVDGNRNYDYHWGEKGGSHKPCEEIYSGPSASSEPEVKIMSELMVSKARKGKTVYLSFHSFGYWLLYPWSYTQEYPTNSVELERVARLAADAIHSHTGAAYRVGNTVELMYPAAGGSHDFAMGAAGIDLAFTFELPPMGDITPQGFLPDPKEIVPMCEETMFGIEAIALYLSDIS